MCVSQTVPGRSSLSPNTASPFAVRKMRLDRWAGTPGGKRDNVADQDLVVGTDVVRDDAELLVITENGYGKRTPFAQYRPAVPGGMGIKTLNKTEKTGEIIGGRGVYPGIRIDAN